MKKISLWMKAGSKSCALLFMSLCMCSVAFSGEKENPVNDFALNMDYCYYMTASMGGVQDELENQYSTALTKTLSFLQEHKQDMTMLEAILVVRSECEARIFEAAKARTP